MEEIETRRLSAIMKLAVGTIILGAVLDVMMITVDIVGDQESASQIAKFAVGAGFIAMGLATAEGLSNNRE